jgi:hypothetical protein
MNDQKQSPARRSRIQIRNEAIEVALRYIDSRGGSAQSDALREAVREATAYTIARSGKANMDFRARARIRSRPIGGLRSGKGGRQRGSIWSRCNDFGPEETSSRQRAIEAARAVLGYEHGEAPAAAVRRYVEQRTGYRIATGGGSLTAFLAAADIWTDRQPGSRRSIWHLGRRKDHMDAILRADQR